MTTLIEGQAALGPQVDPDPQARTTHPFGVGAVVGPSFSGLRGNTNVVPREGVDANGLEAQVRRSGVNPHNRGWFKRG